MSILNKKDGGSYLLLILNNGHVFQTWEKLVISFYKLNYICQILEKLLRAGICKLFFFCNRLDIKYFSFSELHSLCHNYSAQLWQCKSGHEKIKIDECSCGPVKLYLQKQPATWLWPRDHCLQAPALE